MKPSPDKRPNNFFIPPKFAFSLKLNFLIFPLIAFYGVISLDTDKKEIIAASYGYDSDGRYTVDKAYSVEGKFLRIVGDKERE